MLYDPDVNIRLGALYIGSLYKKFGREIQLTAGAYNAGPRAMATLVRATRQATRPTSSSS